MNREGYRVQQIGIQAELRIVDIAINLGLAVERSPELDHGSKTDCIIQGYPIQISATGKSRRERKKLEEQGIYCLVAGEHIPNERLISRILDIVGNVLR